MPMQALILAGGKGLRLRPLTEKLPKCLVDVGGKPILLHILEWLSRHGVDEAVLAVGYKHEAVSDFLRERGNKLPVRVQVSVEEEPLGTGGGTRRALEAGLIKDDFVAINGDVITDVDLGAMISVFRQKKNEGIEALMAMKREKSPYGVLLVDGGGYVHSFVEKPELEGVWINAGIYVLSYGLREKLPKVGDLEREVFPKLAWEHKLAGYKISGYWRSVDSLKDIEEVNGELKDRLTAR